MSYCLYCNAEISSTATFCRGHVVPWRLRSIREYNTASPARRSLIKQYFRRFGWWDNERDLPLSYRGVSCPEEHVITISSSTGEVVNSSITYDANVGSTATATTSCYTTATTEPEVRTYPAIRYRFRKFGVELETVSSSSSLISTAITAAKHRGVDVRDVHYTHDTCNYWKATSDGSLTGGSGKEFVSPVITSEDGFSKIRDLVDALRTFGVSTNGSCGFHVHLDASDLTANHFLRIFKFYQTYEADIDRMMQRSRRGTAAYYCGSLANIALPESASSIRSFINETFNTRYLKLNPMSYISQGTIEFRHHGATLDPNKIEYWVKFCTRIVEYAKSDRPIDHDISLFEALNLSNEEKFYWNHRIQALGA